MKLMTHMRGDKLVAVTFLLEGVKEHSLAHEYAHERLPWREHRGRLYPSLSFDMRNKTGRAKMFIMLRFIHKNTGKEALGRLRAKQLLALLKRQLV